MPCCEAGDNDYFCTSSETERQAGYAEMNSNHTVLKSTKGHQPHLTLPCCLLKLSCLGATSMQPLKCHMTSKNALMGKLSLVVLSCWHGQLLGIPLNNVFGVFFCMIDENFR